MGLYVYFDNFISEMKYLKARVESEFEIYNQSPMIYTKVKNQIREMPSFL